MTAWSATDVPDQRGRTALVTGASSGLGLEAAIALAAAGARVVLGCRDERRGAVAVRTVRERTPRAEVEVLALDLASLESIRRAATDLAGRHDGLDLLVNNAGVMATPLRRTVDGFEQQIGVNHLGHFALTGLLLDQLRAAASPRVTTVSSVAHRRGRIDLDDLLWEHRRYRPWGAYCQSKLANLLFTLELARRTEAAGMTLTATAAHPGLAATSLARDLSVTRLPLVGGAVRGLTGHLGQSAAQGALPVLFAATMPDVLNGDYLGPDGRMEHSGGPTRVSRSERAADADMAAALWVRSEQLTGVRYPF